MPEVKPVFSLVNLSNTCKQNGLFFQTLVYLHDPHVAKLISLFGVE